MPQSLTRPLLHTPATPPSARQQTVQWLKKWHENEDIIWIIETFKLFTCIRLSSFWEERTRCYVTVTASTWLCFVKQIIRESPGRYEICVTAPHILQLLSDCKVFQAGAFPSADQAGERGDWFQLNHLSNDNGFLRAAVKHFNDDCDQAAERSQGNANPTWCDHL